MTIFLSCKHYLILVLARWRRCFVDAHQTSAKGCTGYLQLGEWIIHTKIFQRRLANLVDILRRYQDKAPCWSFPSPRHNLQCSMKPREPDSSLKLPFYCQFIPFFSYTERLISKNCNIVYSYMFFIFQVTARRGDYRPLPPSLVTRSTKLKNPSEQPPKNQGAGGRKEQFLKIDCSIGRDQHTWIFCCDR